MLQLEGCSTTRLRCDSEQQLSRCTTRLRCDIEQQLSRCTTRLRCDIEQQLSRCTTRLRCDSEQQLSRCTTRLRCDSEQQLSRCTTTATTCIIRYGCLMTNSSSCAPPFEPVCMAATAASLPFHQQRTALSRCMYSKVTGSNNSKLAFPPGHLAWT